MGMKLLACLDAVLNHGDRGCFVLAENREPLLRCRRPRGKEVSKLEEQPFLREISRTSRPAAEILSGIGKSACASSARVTSAGFCPSAFSSISITFLEGYYRNAKKSTAKCRIAQRKASTKPKQDGKASEIFSRSL